MALRNQTPRRWPSRLHFLVRFLGLTGLLVVLVGGYLVYVLEASTPALADLARKESETLPELGRRYYVTAESAVTGTLGEGIQIAAYLLLGGIAAAILAALVEGIVALRVAAGHRSAAGLNTAVQVGLALVLLVAVNVFSFRHYLRFDWTRDQRFTLPAKLQDDLRHLRGETTVIVYQQHKTFSKLSDKPDAYDYAAERKVVEKVKDLVDQLREFGPQFRVEVLDVEDEGYGDKLDRLVKDNPELRKAFDAAPENSIFFHAKREDGKELVQRLSFNEFYQLDKVASKQADDGRGNLVLRDQSLEPFALRVLSIDETRPRVGIATIHPLLTSLGTAEQYTLAGVRKALSARGFDVRDVILKDVEVFPFVSKVTTFDENRYEELEESLADVDAEIKLYEEKKAQWSKELDHVQNATLEQLTKEFAKAVGVNEITEPMRKRRVLALKRRVDDYADAIADAKEDQARETEEKARLSVDRDSLLEQQRISDLQAKFDRQLADCDLLIVPRMTHADPEVLPNWLHHLDKAQTASIKKFMASGKPVLACFGPINDSPNSNIPPEGRGPDEVEKLLGQLGLRFGRQTVLFNAERKSFTKRRRGLSGAAGEVQVPPLDFTGDVVASRPSGRLSETDTGAEQTAAAESAEEKLNPIRVSMRIVSESLGKDLDISLRYPRPISYDPEMASALQFTRYKRTVAGVLATAGEGPLSVLPSLYLKPEKPPAPRFEPEFLLTSKDAWNDDQPFPTRERTPRLERSEPDDPSVGTADEKRRGPFSIGVALVAPVPTDWVPSAESAPTSVRVAAIGHGHLFVGNELSPAKERLLLNTCNWLLGREDRMPHEGKPWSYPRVHLEPLDSQLWHWGTLLGLPLLFAYLGVVVVMIRRLR